MLDLNLYKNYNMSLSEIHKLKNQQAEEEIEVQKVQKTSKLKPLIKYGLVAIFAFTLAAGISLKFILTGIDVPVITAPNISILTPEQMNTVDIQIKTVNHDEYIQIQVLDFMETSEIQSKKPAPLLDSRDTTPDRELLKDIKTPKYIETVTPEFLTIAKDDSKVIKTLIPPKPESNPFEPIKQGVVTPALLKEYSIDPLSSVYKEQKPVVKIIEKYSIYISEVDENEYNTLVRLANNSNSDILLLNKESITRQSWTIYKVDINGTQEIDGLNVAPVKTFEDKDEAIAYAQDIVQVDSFIKLSSIVEYKYNINVCCMELNEAKLYAHKSGIVDKTFSLQKIVNN